MFDKSGRIPPGTILQNHTWQCHGLIYMLDEKERRKFIRDCYKQLDESGYMVFTAITKKAVSYGQGKQLSADRFEMFGGANIFFHVHHSIETEFSDSGLFDVIELQENYPFYLNLIYKLRGQGKKLLC